MPGTISYQNRFPLPDNWNVDDYICVVVPLPNDPQYIGIFRGLLETLTWQRSFMLHPTENAAYQVSKTWERCFASRELKFDDCGEFDMALDFRVKPGIPYTTQVSTDGGLTWHDMLIQPHWDGATVAPPITSQDDANALSAALMKQFWLYLVQQINDGIDGGQTKSQTISQISGTFVPYGAGASFSDAVAHAYDTFNAMGGTEQAEWLDDCNYTDMYDDMRDFANSNPYAWLDMMAQWLFDHLDDWSDTLMYWLNSAAASLGGSQVWNWTANQGGAGGGAGFGAGCTGSHTFDFTLSDGGFVDNGGALWSPGDGWYNTVTSSFSFKRVLPASLDLTEGSVTWTTPGGGSLDAGSHMYLNGVDIGHHEPPGTFSDISTHTVSQLDVGMDGILSGSWYVTEMTIYFTGLDPF